MAQRTLSGAHRATLDVLLTFYWCREDNTSVCRIQSTHWQVPIATVEGDGRRHITLSTAARLQDVAAPSVSPTLPFEYMKESMR